MADVVSRRKRSQMMSGIKSKNTKPEWLVRQLLHRKGFRYRLHCPDLPGKPDLVLPKHRCVVLINGCFWHGHDCHLFKMPKTRREFWSEKISGNRARDKMQIGQLIADGWRVVVVWECALKGKTRLPKAELESTLAANIIDSEAFDEISGKKVGD